MELSPQSMKGLYAVWVSNQVMPERELREIVRPKALKEIPTASIEKNPHNPRMIFDKESLAILRDSIKEVGILVPLTVYQRKNAPEKYVLLDGERRWRCAEDLGLSVVPANVIPEPSDIQNIITMFNIHQLREKWQITPTALKLEVLMRLLDERDTKKLATITGLTAANVERCKKLLSFDKRYLDMTMARREDQIPADYFTEMHPVLYAIERKFPKIYKNYSRNGLTDKFVEKYRTGVVKDVIDFRDLRNLVVSIDKGAPKDRVAAAITEVLTEPSRTFKEAYELSARISYDLEAISKFASTIIEKIHSIKITDQKDRNALLSTLRTLKLEIEKTIRKLES